VLVLEADKLDCVRGGHPLFSGLSFVTRTGTALALTGPNGVGKSSLLRVIAGLLPLNNGTLSLKNLNPDRQLAGGDSDHPLGQYCHYLGHRDAIKASMTTAEMLDFWSHFLAAPPDQGLSRSNDQTESGGLSEKDALERVGLGALRDLSCQMLSAGQRRRLTLARLLVIARPVWLLDEPTTALDAAGQDLLWSLCRDHLDAGGVVVIATHAELGVPNQTIRLERPRA
jgi:heme exporter protein A